MALRNKAVGIVFLLFYCIVCNALYAQDVSKEKAQIQLDSLIVVAKNLKQNKEYPKAIEGFKQCVERSQALNDRNNKTTAALLKQIGSLYNSIRDNQQGIVYYKQAKQILEECNDTENPDYLYCLDMLGYNSVVLSDFENAAAYKKQALLVRQKYMWEKTEEYLKTLEELIDVLWLANNYKAIPPYQELLLKIRRLLQGNNHPKTCDALNSLANCYFILADYKSALIHTQDLIGILRQDSLYKKRSEYLNALDKAAYYYELLKQHPEAIRYRKECLQIYSDSLGDNHPDCAKVYRKLASGYEACHDTTNAIACEKKALEIYRKVSDKLNVIEVSRNLVHYDVSLGNYQGALVYKRQLLPVYKELYGEISKGYAGCLESIALFCYILKDYNGAAAAQKQVIEIFNKIYGEASPEHLKALQQMSMYNREIEEGRQVMIPGTSYLDMLKKRLEVQSGDSAGLLDTIVQNCMSNKDYEQALYYGEKLLSACKKKRDKDNSQLLKTLDVLIQGAQLGGNCRLGQSYAEQALNIYRERADTLNVTYARLLKDLAVQRSLTGDISEAILIGKNSLERYKACKNFEANDVADVLTWLSREYSMLHNYRQAVIYGQQALEIYSAEKSNEYYYISCLTKLASDWYLLEDYSQAIAYEKKVLNWHAKSPDNNRFLYTMSLTRLAGFYLKQQNYKQALISERQALDDCDSLLKNTPLTRANCTLFTSLLMHYLITVQLVDMTYGRITDSPECMELYHHLFGKFNTSDCYREIIRYSQKTLELERQNMPSGRYMSTYYLTTSYFALKDYKQAIRYIEQALEEMKQSVNDTDISYVASLFELGKYSFCDGDIGKAATCLNQASQLLFKYVSHNFGFLTKYEREVFWKSNKLYLEEIPKYCYRSNADDRLTACAYDAILFSKGLLLNTERALNKILLESKDTSVMQTYGQLEDLRLKINRLKQMSGENNKKNIDFLENEANTLEQRLLSASKKYGDYTRSFRLGWKDIQNVLSEKEVAIEFTDIKLGEDSVMYIALLLRKDSKSPRMIPLFEKKQLDTLSLGTQIFQKAFMESSGLYKEYIYKSKELTRLIWSPILKYIQHGDDVYFSPSGVFHQLGIEYLALSDSTYIFDDYHFFRLSTTRQFVLRKKEEQVHSAVIYGGLQYDADTTILKKQSLIYNVKNTVSIEDEGQNIADTLSRGGFKAVYLPGSKKEGEAIFSTFAQKHLDVRYYSGMEGCEESFKALSGEEFRVLHIATHGFYFTEKEINNMFINFLDVDAKDVYENQALSRSGLLFSGVGWALSGVLSDKLEDGILTAKEISQLDFSNLELVVLSACQTGLGEIDGEGVFGLQRGFKKAGAGTIVMSLWKVDDEATRIMMAEFYKNLLLGQTKRDAFVNAQSYLRNYEKTQEFESSKLNPATGKREMVKYLKKIKYDNPRYWAAFVMLD